MTHATWALQSHDLSGEGINSGSHNTFLTIQGHGEPPWRSDQLNAGATSETTQTWKTIHTIHTPIHSNKANMKGWLWRQNDILGPVVLKLPDICLTSEGNPEKTLIQETCPDRGSNPGPLRDRRTCYRLFHSDGQNNNHRDLFPSREACHSGLSG